jgi:hypothetical protein
LAADIPDAVAPVAVPVVEAGGVVPPVPVALGFVAVPVGLAPLAELPVPVFDTLSRMNSPPAPLLGRLLAEGDVDAPGAFAADVAAESPDCRQPLTVTV